MESTFATITTPNASPWGEKKRRGRMGHTSALSSSSSSTVTQLLLLLLLMMMMIMSMTVGVGLKGEMWVDQRGTRREWRRKRCSHDRQRLILGSGFEGRGGGEYGGGRHGRSIGGAGGRGGGEGGGGGGGLIGRGGDRGVGGSGSDGERGEGGGRSKRSMEGAGGGGGGGDRGEGFMGGGRGGGEELTGEGEEVEGKELSLAEYFIVMLGRWKDHRALADEDNNIKKKKKKKKKVNHRIYGPLHNHHPRYSSPWAGREWMGHTNQQLLHWSHLVAEASWNFETNITDDTRSKLLSIEAEFVKWKTARVAEGQKFMVENFENDLFRQFMIFTLSAELKDVDKARRKSELSTQMMTTYNTAKVCLNTTDHSGQPQKECLPLEPDLDAKMAESRDPEELRAVWEGWREEAKKDQRQKYQEFVELLNEGARDNDFEDYSEYWTKEQFYEDTDMEALVEGLWRELRPLYLELHGYVRGRLRAQYGENVVGTDGTIPAHLLGNMWAQSWENIYPLVTPFPEQQTTTQTQTQTQTGAESMDQTLRDMCGSGSEGVRCLFNMSETFYASLGLFNMTPTFWQKSLLEKPTDREVQCHASASDMFSPGDFRIKMCTSISMEYLSTIHHEMGHVEYFMAYAPMPAVYRDSPNSGFHEAIGDTTVLALMSRAHLSKLGLTSPHNGLNDDEEDLNGLMKMALTKVAFLPFSLVVDRWRWSVFQGKTLPDSYNHHWWTLRLNLQGLRSPVPRSEEDFDPIAKMHVPSNSPYIAYFLSHVLQFQFYQALCKASGHTGPLYQCDFADSIQAGTRFKDFMALGASLPWQEALKKFTGSRHISAQPMLQYFQPLMHWLRHQNRQSGERLGWDNATVNWEH